MLPPVYRESGTDLTRAGALLANGLVTIDEAVALCGVSISAFIEALDDETTQSHIEVESVRMKLTGKLTEARALSMLDKLLVNIEGQLDTLSPAAATRVAEILLRISGLAEKRAAETRQVTPQPGNGFSINIILSGTRGPVSTGCATIAGEMTEVEE